MKIKSKISLGLVFLFVLFLCISGLGIYSLNRISQNMEDIEAEKTAQDAIFLMALVTTFCFLLSFSFIFNFPSYIANPIRELTEGIKEISNKNYQKRLNFTSKDEFGELATAFNAMAKRLNDYEHSNLAIIISEKQRIETIIDRLNEPLIGLDEKNKILFVNTEGSSILGMTKENLVGQYAPDIALKNDLLRTLLTEIPTKPLKIYANNKESYFEKDVLDITTQDKSIGKVIILRNVTTLQERDLANSQFFNAVSHALKTPVWAMDKTLNLLENTDKNTLSVEQRNHIDALKKDNESLKGMVQKLLSLSKNEAV